ncbi:MAG: acetyl-CoA carboxylase biotin carboxyl carrier protein [Gemmatimonadales bacterium]|jgi:acetyl-CoA carboxylase biotin carboxyl carrier protein|nr:acetyl-CoA carboxylase biotin carboxyl carrier protein [Gemmatimonadales bacterium]MDZ4259257.1 acetyl-CoA carboxylase biotin carboxyl carrier protein [Gemmatimonadales bacterium]MDZ4389809.1 acetyl-CoA carboxylase biotin carboxyl carrier protein [Gemmatimonadales bacterium]
MNPDDMQDLARALEKVPGLKGIEMRDVRRLAQLLKEQPEIGSIELKGFFGTGVVITRTHHGAGSGTPAPMAWQPPPAAAAPAPASAAPAEAVAAPAPVLKEIKSPMVGTYYAQPEPGADPYARVGTRIAPGQTVCIIEAMKIMNEIEAEISGVIREVLVDDSSPVEYGQVLFRVDPNG